MSIRGSIRFDLTRIESSCFATRLESNRIELFRESNRIDGPFATEGPPGQVGLSRIESNRSNRGIYVNRWRIEPSARESNRIDADFSENNRIESNRAGFLASESNRIDRIVTVH